MGRWDDGKSGLAHREGIRQKHWSGEVADGMPISDRDRFIRVTYTDQVPKMPEEGFRQQLTFAVDEAGRPVTTSRLSLTDETTRAAIGTKSVSWAYEREWRYVKSASGKYDFPGPLVEIVFGLRCTLEQRQHYTDLTAAHLENDVRLYEMRRIPDSLVFERVFLGVCTSKLAAVNWSIGYTLRFRDETSAAGSHPAIQRHRKPPIRSGSSGDRSSAGAESGLFQALENEGCRSRKLAAAQGSPCLL